MTAPTLNIGSELILEGTTVNAPSLTLPSGASIDLDSGKISAAGTFSNSGVIRMGNTGAATIRANLLTNDGVLMGKGTIQAVVTNNSNMGFSGDVFFTEDAQNNPGSLIAISGGAGATFYGDVTNNGELRVGAGCTATFYGSFSGSGTTGTGMVYMDGDMMPGSSPGEMSFGGDVVFGMAASLEAELAGTGIGQFDSIDVAGDLVLAGTLDVMLYGGFNPVDGDTFDILDWGTLSGTFGMVNLPGLTEGLDWDESNLYITGEISVMSELALLEGDANRDGVVSADDYASVQGNFGDTGPAGLPGDANGDGAVSADDYASVQGNFGATAGLGGETTVPEPATLALLAIGGLAMLKRRFR